MADPLDTTQPAAPPPAPFTPTGLTTGPLITPPGETSDLDVPAGNTESLAPLQDTKDLGALLERHGYMAGGPTGFLQNSPVQAGRGVAPQWTPAPTLSASDANDLYGIPGKLKFDGDIPIAAAKSLYDQKVAYLQRQEILARQQGGFLNRTAQFGVGALNMALDPIDAASAFIPVVGEVRYAGWLAKASGAFERGVIRAGVGAAQGAVAQAPISALRFGLSYENQEDYSAVNALMDIAYGAVGGGGLHAAGGLAGDLLSGRFRQPTTRAAALSTASPIVNMVDNAPLEVKSGALRTAVAQAVQGQPVDVRPYFDNPIIPDVPEGMVRMYHGGQPGEGPRSFTNDYAYAKAYADKSGAPVSYVDVPLTHPAIEAPNPAEGTAGNLGNVALPANVTARAKPLPGSAAEPEGTPERAPTLEPAKGSPESAAKAVTSELDMGAPRTVEEMRLTVERLNTKVAEFKAAGLDNVAELFAQKLRALGYEPGEMPAALSAAGEASGAKTTSLSEQPPGTQALPSQDSTLPEPSGSSTTRQNAPSTLAGPKATLSLGEMDRATNRKIIQGSTDLKQLHSLAVETRNEVNARLRDLLDDIPGADLVGVRVKDLPGLEKKAETRPASTISDYLGGRISLDGPEALTATLDKLRSSGRLLEVEDFLGSDKKQGYRAVHVQMDLGNGMSIELQLVPKEMLGAQKEAHGVYDTFKRLDPNTADAGEMKLLAEGKAKVQAIFAKAWKPIAEKWGHAGPADTGATIPAKFIKNDVAVLPGGEEVKVRYAIVDAKDLTASQLPSFEANPKYPSALQPRDRTRSASAVQVRTIAQKMNPKLLGENPNASDGAPIVGPDGVVESGNGRVMAIHMAYAEKMDTAGKYKAYLAEQGYPIDHLEEPVLVRIRDQAMTPDERAQFGRQANQRTTLAMGTAEEAKADAAALPDHVLELHRGGDAGSAGNREFVTAFNRDVVGPNDRAGMMNKDGGLSVKGRQRIDAALLAKAYDDPGILAALLEDPESNIKAIGKAITDVSPRWALMRKEAHAGQINPKVDISRDLIDAVNLVRKAREQGIKINDLVTQGDAFSGNVSLETEAMLGIFFKPAEKKGEVPFTRPNSMDKIAAALDRYVAEARKSSGAPGLFGGSDVVGPQEILRSAGRQGETGEQSPLFGEPRRSATAGGGPGDSGQSPGGESPPGQAPASDSLGHALRTQADPNTGFADPEDLRGQQAADAIVARGEPKGSAGETPSSPDVQAIESAMALDMERLDAAIKAGQVSEDEAASLSEADKLVSDAEDRAKGIDAAASCIGRGAI